jgi:hypothetical protein
MKLDFSLEEEWAEGYLKKSKVAGKAKIGGRI